MDPKRVRELAELAAGLVGACAAYGGLVLAAIRWLTPFLSDYMEIETAKPVAILVAVIGASLLILWIRNRTARRSKLLLQDRFDLRVRKPEDLLGRNNDIRDLSTLLAGTNLLLIDGESGSGKSALVEFGLVPQLRENDTHAVVRLADYAGDWDLGLARKIFDEVWRTLSDTEREQVGFKARPSVGAVDTDKVKEILVGVANTLGRMPILILDQFDDYQLAHKAKFLGANREWVKPDDLAQQNRTWALIGELLRASQLRLVVVTRSDTRAGLDSIRFTPEINSFTLLRLEVSWLEQWFAIATVDDAHGSVIQNPDAGWTELTQQIKRDLTPEGTSAAVVLPQQVRLIFLGLRLLPSLTITDYHKAASGAGVEALYVRNAIMLASAASGVAAKLIRDILVAFTERGEGSNLKTKVLSLADFAGLCIDADKLLTALRRLEREEVVRERPQAGVDTSSWQLDHDYVARAVSAEARSANKLAFMLQDGADACARAGSNIWRRYQSLLPLATQAQLAWARVRSYQSFVYQPYRRYAAWSSLRALPAVLLMVFATLAWREESLRSVAANIAEGLNKDEDVGAPALVALWQAPLAVRRRVVDRILGSPSRLRDAGPDWVKAFVSIDEEQARFVVTSLVGQLDRQGIDPLTQRNLIDALGSAGRRLDVARAAEVAKDLRTRLDREGIDSHAQLSLIGALGSVGGRLDAAGAAEVAKGLRARLDRRGIDPETEVQLVDTIGQIAQAPQSPSGTALCFTIQAGLASIGWPLREESQSPVWQRFDALSGEKFNHDTERLTAWTQKICHLAADAARLPLRN
jgi:hypothetical protein